MTEATPKNEKPRTASDELDALFAPWNRTDAPGLTVGVAKDGKTIYRRGFGMASLETAVANTPATRMRIGSTTKHFTCLLALLLAEEGKFDLDVPIRTYLTELTGPGGDPSARLLMQHRGGSRCYLDIAMTCRGLASAPRGDALAIQVRQSGRNFAPGEAMIYNNGGYHLVSIALERVGGAPFEDQLKARLFDPVEMPDTASVPSDLTITPGVATLHAPRSGSGWRRGLFPSEEVRGEGAIISTIDDMLRWAAHLRARDRFGSAATWAALTQTPTFPDGSAGIYALGLMIDTYRGARTHHHAGGVFGGSSQMLTFPDHALDIVILANGGPAANPVRLAEQVADIVLADALGPETAKIKAEPHRALLGRWWSPRTEMLYGLLDENGDLTLGLCGAPLGIPLTRLADGRVVAQGGSIGDMEVGLDAASPGGDLVVGFGGEKAAYRKVSKKNADAAAFAEAAIGRYHSADGDCEATIVRNGQDLVLTLAEPYGRCGGELTCLGETVAVTSPTPGLTFAAVTFSKEGAAMTGFRMNTARTRGLAFERI